MTPTRSSSTILSGVATAERLKPIFEEVAESYSSDSGTLVNFIEVDCDLFGGFLCWDIDSYPVIRILVPRREPLVVVERNDKDAPFWARWIRKLVGPGVDPNWNVHPRSRATRVTGHTDFATDSY